MLATRVRMLAVFAGGCLSGSVLIVLWRGDTEPRAASARGAETQSEPAGAIARGDGQHAADVEPSPHDEVTATAPGAPPAPKPTEHSADSSTTEPGRPVADVLAHLEAAYRQKLAEASPSTEAPPQVEASAPVQANTKSVAANAHEAPMAPPETAALAQAPAREAPTREPPVAVAALAPTAAAVPPVGMVPPVGVVPQNVHIGDTHNGDTHNGDTYQVQQVIQYLPMYSPWAYGGYGVPAPTPRSGAPKRVPYPSTLTNPDNPWGYAFPSALWTVR